MRHGREQRHPHHYQIPPEHRRRWLITTIVGLLLAVLAVTGGPWLYARMTTGEPAEPLELSTPTPEQTFDPDAPIDPNGTWQVAEGSQAGYRIGEVLNGAEVEVVGRTDQVTGTVTIADGMLSAADITVDTASIATDQSARDLYFRRAINTSEHPDAYFELGAPVDVSAVGTEPGPVELSVPGRLTIGESTVDVTAALSVQRTADGLEVAGTIPVALSDLGLPAPSLGFVTVDPEGSVETLLLLSR
ncbi:YceI family protein [Actinotalea sp. M2MS4P-6]|uniref:YceI family protein n=1 Tax=Actinotalea sp. M2MS4P-6 TaxID=2983762 RepID=UPI0021E3CF39|nr:YceI family protein [Actinotalea sp. M2MS4P-6]MCV2393953.1 YceI family protein [Actinotalea sp. M2MS4P-6]